MCGEWDKTVFSFPAYLPEAVGRRKAQGSRPAGALSPQSTHPTYPDVRSLLGGDGNFEHIVLLYLVNFPVHGLKRMFTFDTGGKTFPHCISQFGLL